MAPTTGATSAISSELNATTVTEGTGSTATSFSTSRGKAVRLRSSSPIPLSTFSSAASRAWGTSPGGA
eukprot:3967152-Pyramimonas_sp.AAC.1